MEKLKQILLIFIILQKLGSTFLNSINLIRKLLSLLKCLLRVTTKRLLSNSRNTQQRTLKLGCHFYQIMLTNKIPLSILKELIYQGETHSYSFNLNLSEVEDIQENNLLIKIKEKQIHLVQIEMKLSLLKVHQKFQKFQLKINYHNFNFKENQLRYLIFMEQKHKELLIEFYLKEIEKQMIL